MKNTLIICQARYASTRLPGKVLLTIQNKPLLWYLLRRLELVKTPNRIIIATSTSNSNKPLLDYLKEQKIDYYAGDELNVLDRFYQTAKCYNGEIIVRITADCPLIDSTLIDRGLEIFLKNDFDYLSNVHPPTFPDGFDIEIFTFKALETSWKTAKLNSEKEHVTPFIYNNPKLFNIENFQNDKDLSNIRLTVDTKEDFILISKIIEHFHDSWTKFELKDIINFINQNPNLLKINAQYKRNEGYFKSLKEDKVINT
ncbi:MAG: cytidylyltransferase domain-containing protein [Promethearchaeota archaeon]